MTVIESILLSAGVSINVFIFWQNIDHAVGQVIRYINNHDNDF